MMLTDQIKINNEYQIKGFLGSSETIERLHELGLYSGIEFKVFSLAPFKGPVVIQTQEYLIALRYEEAQCIQV